MSIAVTNDKVSRAALERVLRPLVVEAGGISAFASEAASGSNRSQSYWERTLNRLLGAPQQTRTKGRRYVQSIVGFDLADELLTAVGMADLWHGPELRRWGRARECGTQPRRYAKQRSESKMTIVQIHQAHQRYVAGESLRALGRALWQTYGYASPGSCTNSLSEAFLREGLATRDRIDAVKLASTTHGNAGREDRKNNSLRYRVHRKRKRRASGDVRGEKCSETVTSQGLPRPCRNFALAGGTFCLQHDPDRRDEVLRYVNTARAAAALEPVSDA